VSQASRAAWFLMKLMYRRAFGRPVEIAIDP